MKQINLSDKEYKLLMTILESESWSRNNMGCNEPYKDEEKIFTKKERIEIVKSMYKDSDDEEEMDGFLFNFQYVEHLIDKIKKNTKKVNVE